MTCTMSWYRCEPYCVCPRNLVLRMKILCCDSDISVVFWTTTSIGIIDNSGPKLAECLRAFLDESRRVAVPVPALVVKIYRHKLDIKSA